MSDSPESYLLAPYDFEKFKWMPTCDMSGSRKRLLAGGELVQDTLDRFNKGDQALFFGIYVDIARPVSEARLISAARKAWLWLRFEVPTIATRIDIDEDDRPWLVYDPATLEGAELWAERTIIIRKQEVIDLDKIRHEVQGTKFPCEHGDQTWIYLVPGTPQAAGKVTSFGILFQSHHAPFDGTALKIIFNQYLNQLSLTLQNETHATRSALQWGRESKNLLPAVYNVLSPSEPLPRGPQDVEVPTSSHSYYSSIGMFFQGVGESMLNPYTFKPRPVSDGWPIVRRASLRFTKQESSDILGHLKHPSGGRYTFAPLAHASLVMTMIADNPPTSCAVSQKIYNLSFANCRSSLREPFNSPDKYPGHALGAYSMNVPVSLFLNEDGRPIPLDKDALAKCMKALRGAYEDQKRIPSAISSLAQACEIFTLSVKQVAAKGQLLSNHGFGFSSDGRGETYLKGVYCDTSGAPVLSVNRFFTAINRTDPGPFFRVWSWQGVIELSADFNSNSVCLSEVQKHLETWKTFMLLVGNFCGDDY